MNREDLKLKCLERLDAQAMEHPSGHQGELAARYLLRCRDGDRAELMFEKGPRTPANLWVAEKRISDDLDDLGVTFRLSPASALFTQKGANGKPIYGRHSALIPMRELQHADLVCFRITSPGELDRVLNRLTTR